MSGFRGVVLESVLFQFLMVRLKAAVATAAPPKRYGVSIPYGSIKSCPPAPWCWFPVFSFQFLMVRLKAAQSSSPKKTSLSFQFLMVRLKALPGLWWSRNRMFQFLMVRLKVLTSGKRLFVGGGVFQFLMVRLKVVSSPPFSRPVSPFQFLMVRLKVGFLSTFTAWNFVSIPYGSIKRFTGFNKYKFSYSFNSLWFD